MGGKEVHDDTPYFESSNELLAIQREFYKLADMPKKAMNLRNPRCRIRQASSYNLIDFQQRITMERFYLGFTRFTRMTDNRRIPAWYLPLIIMQPITINNRTDNVLYAACHPIYHGVPGFSIGKLLVELAEKFPQASAGGSEQIGGIRLGYENPYNALSQFSELLNTAVPKDIQAGRIPEDVQKDALKMVQNPTLYERFNNAYI